ncbi:MAG: citrate synthase [Candidatus Tectomicrobia bacterium]|uniref:Citrate synthase n=1 Tax=Tectimicrobiota bacterium TaxID=2528274 RepID=A0A932G1E2_UNCTE|nr:citrate synthase [Candidatus Tectomicrobia bacterium]
MADAYVPGLEGVPVTESKISFIDGQKGILEYRGIPIQVLAEESTFEETAYLLLWGKLPTRNELDQFDQAIRHHRRLKYGILDLIKCLPESAHPMEILQAAVAALGTYYPSRDVSNREENYRSVIRLMAKLPTIVAAFERMRQGDEPVRPRDDLAHSANFLWMLTEREPDPLAARILDVCLVLHAEHTLYASTFGGLVSASSLANTYAVFSSAIGVLSGPLHGGANEEVVVMLREIGSVERARPYLEELIRGKKRIMGVGHRVYKVKDPRAPILQRLAEQLFSQQGESPLYRIASEVERVVTERLGAKGIYPNVDFYSGIVYDKLGLPMDQFTPIFAISRVAGWLAHWLEQMERNRLFRPEEIYTGEHDLPYVPVQER